MRQLRVLMVISQFYPIIGGAERQAQKLASALLRQGVQVTVLTGRWRGVGQPLTTVEGVPVHRHFARGVRFPKRELGQGYAYMSSLAVELYRRKDSYDIIHVHQMLYSAWVAGLMGKWLGKPVVVKVSNTGERFDLRLLRRSPKTVGCWMALSMKSLVTRAIAICSKSVEELKGAGFLDEQITLIPNGVEVPNEQVLNPVNIKSVRHRLGIPQDRATIVFVGRLLPKKNVSILLMAIKRLAGSNSTEPILLLVGDGELRPSLEEQARDLGIANLVRFIGHVDDVSPYLLAADIFVLPSWVEGLSNALLEAMAHRLPCVVTSVGGNTDIIQNDVNGILVNPGDVDALADVLQYLIQNPHVRIHLGEEARKTVSDRFQIDKIASRYVMLYEQLFGMKA